MTGFLGRMAARATGATPGVSPRLPSRFEPGGGGDLSTPTGEATGAGVAWPADVRTSGLPLGDGPTPAPTDGGVGAPPSPARFEATAGWPVSADVTGVRTAPPRVAHPPAAATTSAATAATAAPAAPAAPAATPATAATGSADASGSPPAGTRHPSTDDRMPAPRTAVLPGPVQVQPADFLRALPADVGRRPAPAGKRDPAAASREPDVIHVSIGRVEVRAVLAPPAPPLVPARSAAPPTDGATSLRAYLAGRRETS